MFVGQEDEMRPWEIIKQMSLHRLWDNYVDRVLTAATGHVFNKLTGCCNHCGRLCLDVMDNYKAGKADICPSSDGGIGPSHVVDRKVTE